MGGNETIQTDVRIIAATNRDLEQMVADGQFRADLYYRLNGFTIQLPPLRERRDDIMVLLEHFLQRFSRELGKDVHGISPEALDILMRYPWPGNVRELQSVLKQALLHATGSVLVPDFLPEQIKSGKTAGGAENKADSQHADGWDKFVDPASAGRLGRPVRRVAEPDGKVPDRPRATAHGRQPIAGGQNLGHYPRLFAKQDPGPRHLDRPGGERRRRGASTRRIRAAPAFAGA